VNSKVGFNLKVHFIVIFIILHLLPFNFVFLYREVTFSLIGII